MNLTIKFRIKFSPDPVITVNFMSRMVLARALADADGLHWLTLKEDFHWVVI